MQRKRGEPFASFDCVQVPESEALTQLPDDSQTLVSKQAHLQRVRVQAHWQPLLTGVKRVPAESL